jgi:ATP-dependent DNA ligase
MAIGSDYSRGAATIGPPVSLDSRLSLRVRSIIVDGEAVWAGKDGRSDFDRLHSGAHDDQVFLYAFDLLEVNGEDYRPHSLEKRKAKLEKYWRGLRGCGSPNIWTAMARPSLSKSAKWDWKASSPSGGISLIEVADAKVG